MGLFLAYGIAAYDLQLKKPSLNLEGWDNVLMLT